METFNSVLVEKCSTGTAVDLSKMCRCLTLDVIANFVYGESFGALQVPDFQEVTLEAFDSFAPVGFFVRQIV
jgi:hypothetical protein